MVWDSYVGRFWDTDVGGSSRQSFVVTLHRPVLLINGHTAPLQMTREQYKNGCRPMFPSSPVRLF